jgi:hypothetical protein
MSKAYPNRHAGAMIGSEGERAVAVGAVGLLSLAAAPTFAIMALLTAIRGGSAPDMLCSAVADGSRLTGMVPMYALMSAFHLAPWLRLFSTRGRCKRPR